MIIGIAGLVGFIVCIVLLIKNAIQKKPKKKVLIALGVCFVLFIIGVASPTEDEESAPAMTETIATATPEPTNAVEQTVEEDSTEATTESDESLSFNVTNVRNDVTGNWRIALIAESIDMTEYALNYYEKYFESDDEVHAIVNFSYNTTTRINVLGNLLNVTVFEYVDGEEHDAKTLFTGMILGDYFVNKETGEIEEIQ